MWMEIRSAACGADLPNSTNGVLKSLNVHRKSTSTSTRLTGRSEGRVIRRICCQTPAPSSAAASYSSRGMFCRPAVRVRKANGQDFQTETVSSAQKLLSPISQNGLSLVRCSWSCSTWLIRPVSRWNMKDQVITAANTGSAYGSMNAARSRPRPRKASWVKIEAVTPISQDKPTDSTVNMQVTQNECSSALPTGALNSSATLKLSKPDHGAEDQSRMKNWVSCLKAITMPVTIGTRWISSSA